MDESTIAAYAAIAISIMSIIFGAVNHRRIRSECCGRRASVSIDIESTTPLIKS